MVTVLIMLLITATVVGIAMMGFVSATGQRRRRQLKPEPVDDKELVVPFLFDRPTKWLAIKSNHLGKVQSALGLKDPTPCPWTEGFGKVAEHKLFVSPPVNGWVIVVGANLPDPTDDVDKLFHFLRKIASDIGAVHYYYADRVFQHHGWIRMENEDVVRAYVWADETLWNQGELTAAERALEMKCYNYGDAPLPYPFSTRECNAANCDKVIQLAARWSIDPMSLNSHNLRAGIGIAGNLRHGTLR